ncbi:MAG: ribosome biogenesis GTPase YlqF [Bacteriovoracaceae bacterium]|nr:ribosome biogenesis GTPase YlqF [Bacteriovoracaceae bacterium]
MKRKKHSVDDIPELIAPRQINWFPGHMNKALKKIKENLKLVDIVLEIRDARSPLVTANKDFNHDIRQKNRLIVINKTNLADPKVVELWEDWFSTQDVPYIFINCFDKGSLQKIIQLSRKIVRNNILQSNPNHISKNALRLMIVGLPNTGKSTIINRLSNRNATKIADIPGYTQKLLWVKVDKDIEVLDTPGIMPPKIEKHEHGLWLSAIHAIPDKIVEPEYAACYVVEHLSKIKSEIFKDLYKMTTLDTDLVGTLDQIAKSRGYIQKKNEYDYDRVYKTVLSDFRSGNLGLISFGLPPKK